MYDVERHDGQLQFLYVRFARFVRLLGMRECVMSVGRVAQVSALIQIGLSVCHVILS